jgi:hypothetical protein
VNKELVAYGITAPTVISPPTPFNPLTRLNGVGIQATGSSGNLTLNDATSLDAASLSNQIISLPYDQAGGAAIESPIVNGLVISEVPVGATLNVLYSIFVVG